MEGCPIVSARTAIPERLLIASGRFGRQLSAQRVAEMIAAGVRAAGCPEPDRCALEEPSGAPRAQLDALDFDTRMRAARAVVIAWEQLGESTLADSLAFEIATRARQGGVPAYAVTAENALDSFDARILDLQLILTVPNARALAAAGKQLGQVISRGCSGPRDRELRLPA